MQYYSPYNVCPNNEANFPYIPISAPPVFPRSQIVGEGDVTSVTLPDGTLQLYFIPVSRTTCFGNQWGAVPAWFIRTIPNLFAAPQPFASNYRDTIQASNIFLQNNAVNEEISKYQLQFHSDKPTSSTDLHYFCPPPHSFWYPRQSVETQAEPTRSCEECCRACACRPTNPASLQSRGSLMSIDGKNEDKPTCTCHIKVNKVRFSSDDVKYDKVCDNCKNKCNVLRSTSDKSI
ncbi:uncharacterized protein LOC133526821 isoform X2 [Cydia pomonella]|uniref:uncharacterized protein LOC133526821 isoform X2 n=1 Tax=Cydia pomonella TaxID=82600 RepID=UPI002ADD45FE|nr:uncharacterized protein LOC133526821 isoform X2 [Cydia pomonella]